MCGFLFKSCAKWLNVAERRFLRQVFNRKKASDCRKRQKFADSCRFALPDAILFFLQKEGLNVSSDVS
ncbi:hypothetical protein B9T50_02860 [Zymomonas mobilis subsp. mobilis]|nr:hypothetical protein B9T50_02860 [Zymomonas mobilis subsp. mobilis]